MIILFVRWDHTIFGMGFPLDYPVLLHRWARSAGYPREIIHARSGRHFLVGGGKSVGLKLRVQSAESQLWGS